MSDWTIRNLKDDVENSAERFGLAPDLEARFGRKALEVEGGGFSYQRLAPNFSAPFGHRHAAHEEVYLVLSGSGRVKLEGEERELRQWDALRVSGPVARGFAAGPDGMELLAIGFGEGGDSEMLDDYWGGS
ncbi:MAG TPA: cupin domain-containing protein [Gaiellaceae bacterium]|nr:cupin domain-containing protein [Gaiellaceae bacterium]